MNREENNLDAESLKMVAQLGVIKHIDSDIWMPCFKNLETHEFDATTVAAMMYLVYERYTSNVPDSEQIEFTKSVMKYFKAMLKNGPDYLMQIGDK